MNITKELKQAIDKFQQAKQAEKEVKATLADAKDNVVRELLSTLEKEGYSQDSTLYVDGVSYTYKATERAVVDPSLFLSLYEEGKISRDVFVECITIGKEKAESSLGKATVEPFVTIKEGDTRDLRVGKVDKKSPLYVGHHVVGTVPVKEKVFDRKILLKVAK